MPHAKLDNPQSLDLFTYALDNPLSVIDLDGHGAHHCTATMVNTGHGQKHVIAGQCQNDETKQAQEALGQQPITLTLNLGGVKVRVTYRFGAIFSNYGGGMQITGDPLNCNSCTWAQVVSRTGAGAQGPTKDGADIVRTHVKLTP